ncbi:hypothetical protein H1Z61_02515 [Bacillus aquiflavi]|uniref:Uncharacterized protein n=2 Tax=Bacillus aquiflavi TaxID=2672567 RepID=A0A6B3VVU6_9BACI|nr:hypothetical protein [Bacillus aquiflavi]NEY80415.1 hypothetical protein [Bacillus aquiflavi]UAC50094.1 hypothetical protein K6959_13725 [Bacillus aquiflavi]
MPLYMYFPFLYFPEDKTEYIPAAISMFIFMVITVLAFRLVIRISKRQAEKAKKFEEQLNLTDDHKKE